MKDGNSILSSAAQIAVERIRTLRLITEKTGITTFEKQIETLLALDNNTDLTAVADLLQLRGRRNDGGVR